MVGRKLRLGMAVLAAYYLFSTAFASLAHAQPEGVSAIDWNGSEFLIGSFDGSLVRYNGKEFQKVGALNERTLGIDHTRDFWLINAWKSLAKYDGETLNEIASYDIEKIACNPGYCLIFAKVPGEEPLPGEIIAQKKRLLNMTKEEKEALYRDKEKNYKLLKYDGANLTVLKGVVEPPVREIHWNGEEWLILAGKSVYKYDEELLKLVRYEGPEVLKAGGLPATVSAAWDGREWLLAGEFWSVKDKVLVEMLPRVSRRGTILLLPEHLAKVPKEPLLLKPYSIQVEGEGWLLCARKKDPKAIGRVLERTVMYAYGEFAVINEGGCETSRHCPRGLN